MKKLFCLFVVLLVVSAQAASLQLNKGDHISIIGNTLADRMQHVGWLETRIHVRFPKHELVFRNLSFPGDTVTTRPRSANFGSTDQWLTKMKSDVVFMFFGYNESLAGEEGVPNFKQNLAKLVQHTRQQKYNGKSVPRIVLFTPIAHENLGKHYLPDGKANNARLALYAKAIQEVADAESVLCVDLFAPTRSAYAREKTPLTMNGVHLNEKGNEVLAQLIDTILFESARAKSDEKSLQQVREAVLDKNLHWWSRYRTVDGYNVYGGRSRLAWNGQSNADVMQREMEVFDVMTANRDKRVWAAAQGDCDYKVSDSNTPALLEVKSNRRGPKQDGSYPYLGAKEAIGKMKIHEGMEVNVFASEEMFPELINPVQTAVDTDGRLWVATWPTYPHWNPKKPMGDKLVILPDEDGDGVADKMITFADKLNSITGFEFWGGGVLVAAAPELLFLKDTDGDDKADVRIRLAQGVSSADTHHTANALTIGPAGWLYWSRGVFHVTNMETPTKTFRSTRSGVYRFNPRTFEIEFHFPIGPNPHGNVFDRWGFQYATDGTSGTGSYVSIGKGMGSPKQFYQKRVRPVPASGILSSSHFPPEHEGNFLICNAIGFLGVLQHKFSYDGADINVQEVDPIVVSSDPNFRPSDIEVGGDGALYIADWHNALIGHMQHNMRDPNRDDTHGRVYRVTYKGRPLAKPAKMRGKPVTKVLEFLKAPDNGTRYRARLELSGRTTAEVVAAVDKFAAKLDPKKDTQALLECLWVNEEHQNVNVPLLRRALQSADPKARAAAVRTLGHWGTKVKGGSALLQTAGDDAEPLVRAEAVKAAVNFEGLAAAEVVVAAATRKSDVQMDFVLNYARNALKVDQVLNEAVASGKKLSPATQAYMLRNASNAALLKMDKTDAVHHAILTRPGIETSAKMQAATALAKVGNTTPLRVTLNTVKQLDTEDATEELKATGPVAAELFEASRENVTADLEALAFKGKNDVARELGFVGLLSRDPDSKKLWNHALKSTENLTSLLAAVPKLHNKSGAPKLAKRIRPLMFDLPASLRRAQTNQVGHIHHHASAGKGGAVKVEVYRPNFGADIKNYANRKPAETKHVKDFSLKGVGVTIEKVSLRFTTTLNIERPGKYTFFTNSDDGSCLYVDDQRVVNNDGNHGSVERSGKITLTGGGHKLEVTYFDSGGGDGLVVSWQGPGIPKQPIPAKALGMSGPSYATQVAAVRAIQSLPLDGAAKFADFAKVITNGKGRSAAIPAVLAIHEKDWPASAVKSLGAEYASVAAETPFAQRDGAAFKQTLALGEKLVSKLPTAEAEKLRESLGNLDLQVVRIATIYEKMKYNKATISVVSGKPTKIIFVNDDVMPHNLLLAATGSLNDLGAAADKMAADPKGFDKHFIPEDKRVLWATKLLQPGQTAELSFIAPKPGAYPYICTFPLHWKLMNGVMHVVPEAAVKK